MSIEYVTQIKYLSTYFGIIFRKVKNDYFHITKYVYEVNLLVIFIHYSSTNNILIKCFSVIKQRRFLS